MKIDEGKFYCNIHCDSKTQKSTLKNPRGPVFAISTAHAIIL